MLDANAKSVADKINLSWLVSPVSHEIFTTKHFERDSLRINRDDADYYSRLLPEAEMEFILFAASRTPGAVEILSEDDRPQKCRSHAQALEAFHNGKSLRIDAIQRFSYSITSLGRNLEQLFSSSTNVNMYLTPGSGKKALKRHYDTHDVFVLQIHGNKTWRLYGPPFLSPLEFVPLQRQESMKDMRQYRLDNEQHGRDKCALSEEFILKAGDFLYLPRGFWHEAESAPDEISCHLTVGIQPTTYLDLLSVAISKAASSDIRLRKSLPFGFATDLAVRDVATSQITKILDELTGKLDPVSALGEVAAHFLRKQKTGFENHLLRPFDITSVDDLNGDTQVHVNDGMICGIKVGTSSSEMIFGTKTFAITPAYQEACYFIAKARIFTVSELPGNITTAEKVALVRQLVSEGLLILSDAKIDNAYTRAKQPRWLPVRLDPQRRAIQWTDIGTRPLTEPFLHQTVNQYKRESPGSRNKTTGFRALGQIKEDLPPAGFIFHISRCGSTLLSNGLRALPDTIVISEPQPINAVLSLSLPDFAEDATDQQEITKETLLRGLVRAYGQRRTGTERALIIKFSSWNILHLATIRKIWPGVPCVIVIRDPVEVAVSCTDEPPGWMNWKDQQQGTVRSLLGWDREILSNMTVEDFSARMLGEFLSSAARGASNGAIVIDYKDLTVPRIAETARMFGIPVSSDGLQAISASLAIYSKDPRGQRIYTDDQESKQARATDVIRKAVGEWALGSYERIAREHWDVYSKSIPDAMWTGIQSTKIFEHKAEVES